MAYQKFHIGDCVCIRPFDLIDTTDIGGLSHTESICYGIPRGDVEKGVGFGDLIVQRASQFKGTYVYYLAKDGHTIGYQWAQGMLEFAYADPVVIPADADEFLARLFA